jgi:hypothetical protein
MALHKTTLGTLTLGTVLRDGRTIIELSACKGDGISYRTRTPDGAEVTRVLPAATVVYVSPSAAA